jgi:hypothetical protein
MEYDKLPYFDCVFLLQAYQARLKEGADEVNEVAFLKHGIKSGTSSRTTREISLASKPFP